MRKLKWTLVSLMLLALLAAPQAFAEGKGKGMGQGQGNGNQFGGAQKQGQWVDNQPHGWSSQGKKQGWTKQGSDVPVGLDKNSKSPKGLQKTR